MRIYARNNGAICQRYYDLISGNEPQRAEETAENVKDKILAEYKRLGGGVNGN